MGRQILSNPWATIIAAIIIAFATLVAARSCDKEMPSSSYTGFLQLKSFEEVLNAVGNIIGESQRSLLIQTDILSYGSVSVGGKIYSDYESSIIKCVQQYNKPYGIEKLKILIQTDKYTEDLINEQFRNPVFNSDLTATMKNEIRLRKLFIQLIPDQLHAIKTYMPIQFWIRDYPYENAEMVVAFVTDLNPIAEVFGFRTKDQFLIKLFAKSFEEYLAYAPNYTIDK